MIFNFFMNLATAIAFWGMLQYKMGVTFKSDVTEVSYENESRTAS